MSFPDPPSGLSGIFSHFFNRLEVSQVFFQSAARPSGHKKNGISVFLDSGWPQGPVSVFRSKLFLAFLNGFFEFFHALLRTSCHHEAEGEGGLIVGGGLF